jgi:hypothetical protein
MNLALKRIHVLAQFARTSPAREHGFYSIYLARSELLCRPASTQRFRALARRRGMRAGVRNAIPMQIIAHWMEGRVRLSA